MDDTTTKIVRAVWSSVWAKTILAVLSLLSASVTYMHGFTRGISVSFSTLIDSTLMLHCIQVALLYLGGSAVIVRFFLVLVHQVGKISYRTGFAEGRLEFKSGLSARSAKWELSHSKWYDKFLGSLFYTALPVFLVYIFYLIFDGFLTYQGVIYFFITSLIVVFCMILIVVIANARAVTARRLVRTTRVFVRRFWTGGLLSFFELKYGVTALSIVLLLCSFNLGYARFISVQNSPPLCFDSVGGTVTGSLIAENYSGYIIYKSFGVEVNFDDKSGSFLFLDRNSVRLISEGCDPKKSNK